MSGHRTSIPGYRIKDGKVIKTNAKKSVSQRIRDRKKTRIARKGSLR